MEGINLYHGYNTAELSAASKMGFNFKELLRNSQKQNMLPANAIYVNNTDVNCKLKIYVNDLDGAAYYVKADTDLFFTGSNVWQIIVENLDAANNVAADDIEVTAFKTAEFTGVD